MAKGIVGLDIGRDTLRAVEIENADKAKPTVVRIAHVPIPDGAVRSGEVREINTVVAAIRKLWSTGGFKSKDVVLGIGNQRVIARDLTVPKMSYVQIRESLPFQVQEMLPVPVGDALLDFYPVSEGTGDNGDVVNGLLVAAIKDSIMGNVNAVRQAGLSPVQVDLIPFALSRALVRGPIGRGTVAIIDIGGSTTNVVVSTAGVPQFVRMIPVGGEDLTKALSNKLELSPQQADVAKRTRGFSSAPVSSEAERRVAEVIHETTTELLNSLRNTINYFTNTRQNDPVQAILLTGGGSKLRGLSQALGEATRIQVISVDPFDSIDVARTLRKKAPEEFEGMAVALGLAVGSVA
jgi:type IV pilus assembly protein PilM